MRDRELNSRASKPIQWISLNPECFWLRKDDREIDDAYARNSNDPGKPVSWPLGWSYETLHFQTVPIPRGALETVINCAPYERYDCSCDTEMKSMDPAQFLGLRHVALKVRDVQKSV